MSDFPESDEEYELVETSRVPAPTTIAEKNVEKEFLADVGTREPATKPQDVTPDGPPESPRKAAAEVVESIRKRTYEELISDFGDLFEDENFTASLPSSKREKRPRWDEPEAVIKLILEERKKQHSKDDGSAELPGNSSNASTQDCISIRVPRWRFVAVTRPADSQRIYVKVRSKDTIAEKSVRPVTGLLSVPYSQMKAEAEEIILKNVQRASLAAPSRSSKKSDDQLWVDKYRPRTYMELLSDESVNRSFLSWMKLWDKIVFNREVVRRKKHEPAPSFGSKKFFRKQEVEGLDPKGFPTHRIALLSGPPGLGKTTLAHLVARHAGYNVVEVNASDDRGPEVFRQALLASTEMRSLMGSDPRPNCLILDEVDGAPVASIDLLIKFVQGKLTAKGRKTKEGAAKKSEGCRRPIICICNEAYTPSLRALRTMAYIIPVPKVSASRLADRLATIARKERLRADPDALLQLAERSGCDVRSCLCALQYMGKACIDSSFNLGLKDSRRGLFDSWKDILQVPMSRGGPLSTRERVQLVLKASHSGETERLVQGVFQNYPENAPPKLDIVAKSLEWFQFYDRIMTLVMTRQDWRVMPYTNYAFVSWHFGFASNQSIKLSYPYAPAEVNQKLNKSVAILTATKRVYGRDIQTLALDVAPFIFELLTPRLRSVSGHLYSTKERADLDRLINVMLDLGLSLVQMKDDDGNLDYVLDPNLYEIGIFPDCKVRRDMPYPVKQIVAQESEIQRLKRAAIAIGSYQEDSAAGGGEVGKKKTSSSEKKAEMSFKPVAVPTVPNHLRQLEPMPVKASKFRNFFENFVPQATDSKKQKSPGTSPRAPKSIHRVRQVLTKYGVWYKYKEGFSNSVRRDVKISDLL